VVQTTADWCPPCKALKQYADDPAMIEAFKGALVARVDVDTFQPQLDALNMLAPSLPWFIKLDTKLEVVDAISGGEWGEDVPANMAPVLRSFFAGTLTERKDPWKQAFRRAQ
jgi:hypothetical protein